MARLVLNFRDEEFVIPENRLFDVADQIEDLVASRVRDKAPLFEIMEWHVRPRYQMIARCFAIMLAAAGKIVTPEDVRSEMMGRVKDQEPSAHLAAVSLLIELLMDGAPPARGTAPEKPDAS